GDVGDVVGQVGGVVQRQGGAGGAVDRLAGDDGGDGACHGGSFVRAYRRSRTRSRASTAGSSSAVETASEGRKRSVRSPQPSIRTCSSVMSRWATASRRAPSGRLRAHSS